MDELITNPVLEKVEQKIKRLQRKMFFDSNPSWIFHGKNHMILVFLPAIKHPLNFSCFAT